MLFFRRLTGLFLVVYLLPTLSSAALWYIKDRPQNWRQADWSSAHILPDAAEDGPAAVYILSAATGGMKGAVATHSWIVLKQRGEAGYERYDKVGWGNPIRRNGYPADAFWYSNRPDIVGAVHGEEAEKLIPEIRQAIEAYPYARPGGYRMWPGPNSNTFVAHVLRAVPEIGIVLPPQAVGRDYLADGKLFAIDADGRDFHATLHGLLGIAAGARSGFEVHVLWLVAGFDFADPAIKIPAFGRLAL